MSGDAPKVLVVDDESDIRELLTITLERMGLQSLEAGTVADAKSSSTCSSRSPFLLRETEPSWRESSRRRFRRFSDQAEFR